MKNVFVAQFLVSLVLITGLANAAPTSSPPTEEIPLASIYSTNGQQGLKPMSATFFEKGEGKQYQEPYGYQLEQIHRELHSGLSNLFLVRGKDITQAVKAARFAFGGGRSGDKAIVEDADAADAQLWAVAYFGVAGSTPPVWLVRSVTVRNGKTVDITYRRNPSGGETRDMHRSRSPLCSPCGLGRAFRMCFGGAP